MTTTEIATEIHYKTVIGKCDRCQAITKKLFSANDSSTSVWITCSCGRMYAGKTAKTVESKKCDARCTAATGPSCSCSCGGKNHAEAGVWA